MLEIQYHPSDIRRAPRYFFVRPAAVRRLVLGLLAGVVLLAVGVSLAPRGVAALVLWGRLVRLEEHLAGERETLARQTTALDALQARYERARLLERQMELIFGAEGEESFAGGATAILAGDGATGDPGSVLLRARALAADTDTLAVELGRLVGYVRSQHELTATVPSLCPLPAGSFVLTSPYGSRRSPFTGSSDFHSGLDLAARAGEPVRVTGDGVVTFAGRFPLKGNVALWRLGNAVVVNHGDRYLSIYAHLQEIRVTSGGRVRRRQLVGTVGNTGWSTSPHLHYEVRLIDPETAAQVPLDPRIFILDHDWSEREALLVARRTAPPPPIDPLPSLARTR